MFLFMNKNPCHFELSNEIRQEKTLKILKGYNTYGDSDWNFCLILTYPWHSRYQCKSYPGSTVIYTYLSCSAVLVRTGYTSLLLLALAVI